MSVTPAVDHSDLFQGNVSLGHSGRSLGELDGKKKKKKSESVGESEREGSNWGCDESLSFRLGNLQKYVEGEQVAAGWPAWLTAVASEAIHGWVPLRADAFEKLEKVVNVMVTGNEMVPLFLRISKNFIGEKLYPQVSLISW